ncbi:MAG: hypothetical protein ACE10E_10260 [Acidiferrobacterales bacterium]
MKAFIILAALLGTLMAMPAYAFQCPGDVAKIDAALKAGPNVSAEQLAEAKKLRAEGGQLHKSGQHAQSVATLAKAKEILGIN